MEADRVLAIRATIIGEKEDGSLVLLGQAQGRTDVGGPADLIESPLGGDWLPGIDPGIDPRRDVAVAQLPPATDWGHFHANMAEAWVVVYGRIDVLISGAGLIHGDTGDVINVPEERWHRATSTPGSGKSIRLSIISRSKEGQVLFLQPGGMSN